MHCSEDNCLVLFDVKGFIFFKAFNDILFCQDTVLIILKTSASFKLLLTFHPIVNNPFQSDIFIISICLNFFFFSKN